MHRQLFNIDEYQIQPQRLNHQVRDFELDRYLIYLEKQNEYFKNELNNKTKVKTKKVKNKKRNVNSKKNIDKTLYDVKTTPFHIFIIILLAFLITIIINNI